MDRKEAGMCSDTVYVLCESEVSHTTLCSDFVLDVLITSP